MEAELYKKILASLTDPAALILFAVCCILFREMLKKDEIIARLLKVQEERGIVLTKITVMLEHMFNDSRGPK